MDQIKERKNRARVEQFIKKKKWKGDNQWAVVTFVSFIGIGVALLILHLLVWF